MNISNLVLFTSLNIEQCPIMCPSVGCVLKSRRLPFAYPSAHGDTKCCVSAGSGGLPQGTVMLEKDHTVFLVFIHYLLDAAVTVTDIITPIWLPRT